MTESTSLPYVCLRALVLFPEKSADLAVGREESKKVIQAARESYQNQLVVVTQRRAEQGTNVTADDLYDIGTICSFEASVNFNDLQRVRVIGIRRAKLEHFRVENGVQMVTVTPLNETSAPSKDWSQNSQSTLGILKEHLQSRTDDIDSILETLKLEASHNVFVAGCLDLIRQEMKLQMELPTDKSSPFPEDEKSRSAVNKMVGQEQRLMEESDPIQRLLLLKEIFEQ